MSGSLKISLSVSLIYLGMPKSSVKHKNHSTSKEQSTLLNRRIDAQLHYLQESLGYPLNPCKPTTLVQGEYASWWSIFIGTSSKGAVTGPDHRDFPKLGRLYCTVHACTTKVFKRMEWNSHMIPCVVLETDKDLMDSLAMREVLASRLTHKFGQSTSRSSSPLASLDFSHTLSSSHATTSSPLVYSTRTTAPSTSLSITADAHSISDSDDDFEMSEPFVPDFASPKHISRLGSSPSLRSSLDDSEEEMVTNKNDKFFTLLLVVWTKEDEPYNKTTVQIPSRHGANVCLSDLSNSSIKSVGLTNASCVDRYIPGRGWRKILFDTLFPIHDGDLIALKLSSVGRIKDWDIHVEHMFS
ncbi:hypothetical protein F5050DRAFT_1833146 [Lentinula boryana]|uniref:Uncharacterized protein n=1 Tax=Lentinula boryana TaxID=40481 RepID=A0ABQ8Q8F0_9AGAR|nr:hypothetical protein F5050DRAFT_1833146 [Lentinula boryana]